MDETEIAQFVRGTLPRMAEYTFPFITSVIGVRDATRGDHLGSGLRVILGSQRAIVTVLHVMKKANSPEYSACAVSTAYGERPFVISGKVPINAAVDLAVIPLPDAYPLRDLRHFWPETQIDLSLDRLSTDYLFTHGFPGQRGYFSDIAKGLSTKSLPYGAMQQMDNLPEGIQPFQFALHFQPENMKRMGDDAQEFADPHGLSGSPVWRIGASGRSMQGWKPDHCLLVGFLTDWLSDPGVLLATKVTALIPPNPVPG